MSNEARAAVRIMLLPYALLFMSCAFTMGLAILHEDKSLASSSPVWSVFGMTLTALLLWLIYQDSRAPFKAVILILMMLDTIQNYGRAFIGRPEMTGVAAAVDNSLWIVAII